MLLGLFGPLLVDVAALNPAFSWFMRIGLFTAPMHVSAGFFVGAPMKKGDPSPGRLIILVRIGTILLAPCLLTLGVELL